MMVLDLLANFVIPLAVPIAILMGWIVPASLLDGRYDEIDPLWIQSPQVGFRLANRELTDEEMSRSVAEAWNELDAIDLMAGIQPYPPAPDGKGWFRVECSDAGYGGPGWMRCTSQGNAYVSDERR
jgi:hypothetical protein